MSKFKIGDIVECTDNGWNNSNHPNYNYGNTARMGEKYKVIQIYSGGINTASGLDTFETECGKYLWTRSSAYKIISSSTDYEIY